LREIKKQLIMRLKKYLAIFFLMVLIIISCGKIDKLPPVPSIKFKNFTVFDTTDILGNITKGGRLNFYFEDGDGDIGLNTPNSKLASDSTNLFFTLYRKKNGVMTLAEESAYRIPYMERLGQNKILRGNVSVTFLYLFYTPSDTIKYEFYIKDRSENISNTATTCEIVIKNNFACQE
jgi:hypothetical protein